MKLPFLLPLLGLLILAHSSNGVGIDWVFQVYELSKFLYRSFRVLEKIPQSDADIKEKVFNNISLINHKFDIVGASIADVGIVTMKSFMENLNTAVRSQISLNDLLDHLQYIDRYYQRMQYMNKASENETLIYFAEEMLADTNFSLINLSKKINSMVFEKGNENDNKMFASLFHRYKGISELGCTTKQFQQQRIFNLLSMILLTEMKGEALIQYSYWILQLYKRGDYKQERLVAKKNLKRRLNSAMSFIKTYSSSASRDMWTCDPELKHKKGKTYEEITRLLQGYVQNEVDMSDSESCWKTCSYYKLTNSRNKCYNKQNYCEKRGCNGKILNCKFIEPDMQICPSDPSSNRRYDYIKFESGKQLGVAQTCNGSVQNVEAWWRVVVHCSYCICLCDEADPLSDRYFSLLSSVSNVTENKVVVGVRFVKKNRIIHLQVQEGKLKPFGGIDYKTVHWVPLDNFQIINANIKEGRDYHTLTLDNRSIALDDVTVGKNNIITGIRFDVVDSILTLKVRMTPYDFKRGLLDASKSEWIGREVKNREELKLYKPDIPTNTIHKSLPDSISGQFIKFKNSDLQKDVGQTTVPFIDIQNVESLQPTPLEGIGIYHKGRKGYGGFIAPRMFAYDASNFIQQPFKRYRRKLN